MSDLAIHVILEHPEFVAVSKPAGVLVHEPQVRTRHARVASDEPTVVSWVRKRYPETRTVGDDPDGRPGIVHRLDRDTSGVLLIARTQPFFEYLKKLFQHHEVVKTYIALVWGRTPLRGVIDKPIGLKPGTVKHSTIVYPERSRGVRRIKMVKTAVTEYETVWTREYDGAVPTVDPLHQSSRFDESKTRRVSEASRREFSLVRVTPKTGRTHQIRVHLASIGHPVVGDSLYSRREDPWKLERQFLHADSIEFSMPGGKRMRLSSDLPPDLERILSFLREPPWTTQSGRQESRE